MYFIVVDSGRTGVLGSDVREALRCIRCGACMNHCPVYQNVGGHSYGWVYPGPIGSILTPMYVGLENAQDLPQASTMCNQCGVVCPVKIPLPDLQRKLREQAFAREPAAVERARGAQAWALVAQRPALYALGTKIGVRVLKAMGGRDGIIHRLPLGAGWTDGRDMPAPAGRTFRELYRERRARERTPATRRTRCRGSPAAPSRSAPRTPSSCWPRSTRWSAPGKDIVSFCIGQPDFPTPPNVQDAGDRGDPRRAATATRRPPASTSCAPRPRTTSARGAASPSRPTTSSSAPAPSRSSRTRSRR